jgi:hypothetical protein
MSVSKRDINLFNNVTDGKIDSIKGDKSIKSLIFMLDSKHKSKGKSNITDKYSENCNNIKIHTFPNKPHLMTSNLSLTPFFMLQCLYSHLITSFFISTSSAFELTSSKNEKKSCKKT